MACGDRAGGAMILRRKGLESASWCPMILMHPGEDLGAATWVDLLAPTGEEVERVRQATGLRVLSENEINEIESSSRLAFESGAYYVSTPLVVPRGADDFGVSAVGFVLSPRVLITVRFAPMPSFDAARDACVAHPRRSAE